MRLQSLHTPSHPVLFILGILVLIASFLIQHQLNRESAEAFEKKLGLASDFTLPKDSSIQAVSNSHQTLSFTSGDQIHPHLRFFFQCHKSCGRMWLTYQTDTGAEEVLFITHPHLIRFPYHHLELAQRQLFQKFTRYQSIPEFLTQPPDGIVLTDSFAKNFLLNPITNTIDATTSGDVQVEYAYLNYKHPRRFTNDWYEVSRYLLGIQTPAASISATLHHPDWQTHPLSITQPVLH